MGKPAIQINAWDDSTIEIGIKNRFGMDRRLDPKNIQISSRDGVVVLRGTVLTDYERSIAELLAGTSKKVRGVIKEIKVVPPLNRDFALTKAVREDILQNPALKVLELKVEVRDGTARLFGFVKDPKQREKVKKIGEEHLEFKTLRTIL